VGALFFNDDTMREIYEGEGKFQFLFQLPQMICSSVVSGAFGAILHLLALSEDGIIKFKQNKDTNNINKSKISLINSLNIKVILFFIISTIFLFMFWYYLSMSCAIYMNTQIHLIKDTLISFGISLLYPFGIYLLPGIFRIPALSDKRKGSKKNEERKYLYNFSKFLQFL